MNIGALHAPSSINIHCYIYTSQNHLKSGNSRRKEVKARSQSIEQCDKFGRSKGPASGPTKLRSGNIHQNIFSIINVFAAISHFAIQP